MGWFKSDPPTPPNPAQTAAAQTGTNVSTAVANSFLGNMNQITPDGMLRFDPTDTYSWTDPSTGANYNLPRFTSTQLLSPAQQATLARLATPQIIALRFASDSELPALVERADRDRLTADQIKRAITTWVPDFDRT